MSNDNPSGGTPSIVVPGNFKRILAVHFNLEAESQEALERLEEVVKTKAEYYGEDATTIWANNGMLGRLGHVKVTVADGKQ